MTTTSDQAIAERFALQCDDLPAPDFADVRRRAQEIASHRSLASPQRRSRLQRRRRWPLIAAATAAVLAAILLATPAWALRDVLPFWNQPSAPPSVKVEFSTLNRGAPADMSFQAASGDAREVEQATIGGETKTLWVAPATGRFSFCWVWGPNLEGSCGSSAQPLGVAYTTIPPHDPSQPAQTTHLPSIPVNGGYPENGVSLYVVGSAISPTISDVVVRFSDGSSVHPHIVWVSAPINAGFFAYDIPADQQSSEDHATVVDAYDQNGKLVDEQRITGG